MSIGGQQFQQGQHICAVYDTRDEQVAIAAAFVADGLRARERCLYVAESRNDLDLFRDRLRTEQIDVGAAQRSRSLILLTTAKAHLVEGRFDCERMLKMLNDAVEAALNAGFAGLRTCGDMSWLVGNPPGAEQVVEYEAVLNEFFRNVRGLGTCQYDRQRLPAHLLDQAGLRSHSTAVVGGDHGANPDFEPPASRDLGTGDSSVRSNADSAAR